VFRKNLTNSVNTLAKGFAATHMRVFAHRAQKVPFSHYCEISDAGVSLPVSQPGEGKEGFSFWAPARATVVRYTPWLPPPGRSPGILVVAAQSLGFLQSCFPSELFSFMLSPSTPAVSFLPMARFGGTAK